MSLRNGIELRFHPAERKFPCWYDGGETHPAHPCFVASGIHRTKDNKELHCEAYQFYFKSNDAIGLFGVNKESKALGYHDHDVEGILVTFNVQTGKPMHVYFKAHATGQGYWKAWEECEKNPNGGLVVYVALGSHAMYYDATTRQRILGLANDFCSNKGSKIYIGTADYVLATRKEFAPGIVIYDTVQMISNDSVTLTQRVFLPFVHKDLKQKVRKEYGNLWKLDHKRQL